MKAKASSQSALQIVVEDAADAAHLVAVLEEEIFVAPFLVFVVGRDRGVGVAGRLHRGVEGAAVGIVLRAAAVEHRREVGAAAEPGLGGDDEARVHVHGRHVRIVRMRDQRNARRPEARIGVGAGDVLAEFRRELAMHGRAMHADLLEHAAVHHRHHAAAARLAGMVGALPGRALETARRAIGQRRRPAATRPRPLRAPRRCRRAGARTRRGRWSLRVSSVGERRGGGMSSRSILFWRRSRPSAASPRPAPWRRPSPH